MKKKVSQKDIARKVGVSTALVSYVLNNKNEGRISKQVAQQIRDVAAQLNYRVNQIAKSLKTNTTFTIGLIVADISNSYFSGIARIIEDEAQKSNYTVIFGSCDESAEKLLKLINTLVDRQVDGFIIAPSENTQSHLQYLRKLKIPFVLIDRYFPQMKVNYVALNNYKSSYKAVEHLIKRSHKKRIGFITYHTALFHLQERSRGYYSAMKENHLAVKKSWEKKIHSDNITAGVEKALDELLKLSPSVDAILFGANTLGFCGLKYIHSLGIKIPDDLAIITFDEIEASDLFYAPLSYIKQPLQKIGQLATQILLENMNGAASTKQVNLDAELIIRKST